VRFFAVCSNLVELKIVCLLKITGSVELCIYLQLGTLNMKKLLAMTAVAALTLSANVFAQEGEAVYNKACQVCHSMGVAGAPKSHDVAAWEPRLAKGVDALVNSVKTGLNAMPPGGMCTDCSDEDYENAIEFMSK
jgi:cytochrome c5